MTSKTGSGAARVVAATAATLIVAATSFAAAPVVTASVAPPSGPASTVVTDDATIAATSTPEISAERCASNREAGTITYLSGYRYAANASMIDVLVAQAHGYYEQLCLDVEYVPSFSTDNYPLVAAGAAQFASAGSFSEMVRFAADTDADLLTVLVKGNFPIETLVVRPGVGTSPADLAGTTIGVKGAMPAAVTVMLADAGLVAGDDYQTVLLDGFDPLAHFAIDDIAGFPAHRSNEPGTLTRAGVEFVEITPADYGVPGSNGVTYTSAQFAAEHPTATEDFVRATLRGFEDAMADPEAAVAIAGAAAEAAADPTFDATTERFRWETEAELIAVDAADRLPGFPDAEALQIELDTYSAVGYFPTAPPPAETLVLASTATLYDADGALIWPE